MINLLRMSNFEIGPWWVDGIEAHCRVGCSLNELIKCVG